MKKKPIIPLDFDLHLFIGPFSPHRKKAYRRPAEG